MKGGCATAQARKGRCACTHARGLKGWGGGPNSTKIALGLNSDDFSFFTLSLGPLEAKICVLSDGLSERG